MRFLDLRPEYRAAIEKLIESHRAQKESQDLKARGRSIIQSGVEPVDKLLGGLDRGHLYLTQGDAAGKSLFGREFLIEGLKNGQTAALITTGSAEDAVRQFARLGYDCREDLRSGSLVTFRYAQDVAEQVLRLRTLAPLLPGLERILDKFSPERVVFDPVNNLLAGEGPDDIAARANEFAVWIRSFGATVVLVANGESVEVIESLTPLVKESIRFDMRETKDRVVRYISFEKSPSVPDHPVRVDPSRGISLLEDPQTDEPSDGDLRAMPQTVEPTLVQKSGEQAIPAASASGQIAFNADRTVTPLPPGSDETHDAFFAMLDELQSFASSLEPEPAIDEEAAALS